MTKLHITAWIIAVLALAAFAGYWHRAGVQAERDQRLYDSLSTANAVLQAASDSALSRHKADSAREALALRGIQGREAAVRAANGRLGPILSTLRDSATAAQQVLIDSLEALHAAKEAGLQARGDTALALFYGAAAGRDTALSLLRASQQEAAGLQVALIAARRKPLWDAPAVKVVQLALAVKGLASIFGR